MRVELETSKVDALVAVANRVGVELESGNVVTPAEVGRLLDLAAAVGAQLSEQQYPVDRN